MRSAGVSLFSVPEARTVCRGKMLKSSLRCFQDYTVIHEVDSAAK